MMRLPVRRMWSKKRPSWRQTMGFQLDSALVDREHEKNERTYVISVPTNGKFLREILNLGPWALGLGTEAPMAAGSFRPTADLALDFALALAIGFVFFHGRFCALGGPSGFNFKAASSSTPLAVVAYWQVRFIKRCQQWHLKLHGAVWGDVLVYFYPPQPLSHLGWHTCHLGKKTSEVPVFQDLNGVCKG